MIATILHSNAVVLRTGLCLEVFSGSTLSSNILRYKEHTGVELKGEREIKRRRRQHDAGE